MTNINNIDKIFLINLPARTDRLMKAKKELYHYQITFKLFAAEYDPNGAYGLLMTMKKLFTEAEELGLNNILVFEDDVTITQDSLIGIMNNIMRQTETIDYDLLYLGANVDGPLKVVEGCPRILQCGFMYASHAIVYSKKGWKKCLKMLNEHLNKKLEDMKAYDQLLVRYIQRDGKCFISNPMIATQRPGYSDIAKEEVDQSRHIENKFKNRLRELRGI